MISRDQEGRKVAERRRFNGREHTTLYLAADGRCQCRGCEACSPGGCGVELEPGWHADHVEPWSRAGKTDVINGQALCPPCNRKKGSRMEPSPREWQKRFISKYHANRNPDFLLVACPGAGKTLASGFVARDLMRDGMAGRLLIVVPTFALRAQWMSALASLGVIVDGETMNNGRGERDTIDGAQTHGWVVTYQSLYSDRGTHRILNSRRPTMAILDEVHHLGEDASWGKASIEALGPCVRRLGLSGTPFRGTRDAIPFVEFDDDGLAVYRDHADGTPYPRGFDYSYGRALHDNPPPVRPILFDQYAGDVAWLEQWTGAEKTVNLGDNLGRRDRASANRHALDHRGQWLRTVLSDADARLLMVRSEGDPAAQGLVLCIDTRHAFAVEGLLKDLTGPASVSVAVSKDLAGRDITGEARETIAAFKKSTARWLVAVAMVTEGIDIPTLRVGVWATVVRSPLRFRQGMGRLIRRTGLPEDVDQTAYMFVPRDPEMTQLADEVYDEVKLALLEKDEPGEPGEPGPGGEGQDELPFDAFRRAEAEDPSIHAPGLGAVDPEYAARIARESGQPLGAVAAVIAAMAKFGPSGIPAPEAAPAAASRDAAASYGKRLKAARGELENLLKQLTSARMRKNGVPYDHFREEIPKVKAEVYGRAGIEKGQYERADIPQLREAINVAKKWWAEL